MFKVQTLEDNLGLPPGSYAATGAAIGTIVPGVGTAIGGAIGGLVEVFSGFFGGNKLTLTPNNPADRQKQAKVAAVWKQRLNSMGYPITVAQSRAILGTHWGGDFNEQLSQYKRFVAKLPLHAIPHPYGTSWNSFIALFPGYNPKAIAKLTNTYKPPIKYPKPYNFTPGGGTYGFTPKGNSYQGSTQKAGMTKAIFPILIILASSFILLGGKK